MSINVISTAQLASVTGGAVQEDPFAPIGSSARCTFLRSEMDNRKNLIAKDAVRGSVTGGREALTPRIFGNGAILSREQLEYQRRCPQPK